MLKGAAAGENAFAGCFVSRFTTRLKQEPISLFRLVDEILQDRSGGYVLMLVGDSVRRPHAFDDYFIIVHQFDQHVGGGDIVLVIVLDGGKPGDLADGMNG